MSAPYSTSYASEFLNSFYVGINVENVLYGIELILYFKTMHILLSDRGVRKKRNIFYALFSTVMLFTVTVWVVTGAVFGQKMWLAHPDIPGGPYAYWYEYSSVWYMSWSRAGVLVLQLMTDGLLIHRCRALWNSNCIVIIPIILWLTALALGVIVSWLNNTPVLDVPLSEAASNAITLAYWTVSAFLNTTLTCMICYRVVRYGKMVREHLGNEYASFYFSIVTVVIESVLPFTLSGIAFLVSLGTGSPSYLALMCVYLLMMCIAPQLLILRVISGRAWDNNTFSQRGSTVRFDHGGGDTTGAQLGVRESDETSLHLQALPNMPDSSEHEKVQILEA